MFSGGFPKWRKRCWVRVSEKRKSQQDGMLLGKGRHFLKNGGDAQRYWAFLNRKRLGLQESCSLRLAL
ncbi:hypothetical protein VNO78_18550 [Psophocarpus tetragonolobus]|uniref:Uncharacterized protein n=1 Tax=Psophocarpus tetragonolobus TaxID=3891 RepID=A0AAN9XLY1_PSOTE